MSVLKGFDGRSVLPKDKKKAREIGGGKVRCVAVEPLLIAPVSTKGNVVF